MPPRARPADGLETCGTEDRDEAHELVTWRIRVRRDRPRARSHRVGRPSRSRPPGVVASGPAGAGPAARRNRQRTKRNGRSLPRPPGIGRWPAAPPSTSQPPRHRDRPGGQSGRRFVPDAGGPPSVVCHRPVWPGLPAGATPCTSKSSGHRGLRTASPGRANDPGRLRGSAACRASAEPPARGGVVNSSNAIAGGETGFASHPGQV